MNEEQPITDVNTNPPTAGPAPTPSIHGGGGPTMAEQPIQSPQAPPAEAAPEQPGMTQPSSQTAAPTKSKTPFIIGVAVLVLVLIGAIVMLAL